MKLLSSTPATLVLTSALALLLLPSCTTEGPITKAVSSRSSASKIEADSRAALQQLYAKNSKARELGAKARGSLVFPNITRAGLVVGGQSGQGALFLPDGKVTYYQTTGLSYGLQAG
ncbi:MAG: hypothetical protein GWO24_18660, partial [Akkermansiaceae bacterium]|nr:hypothetical protein [Akkermansiaceae bacterium]